MRVLLTVLLVAFASPALASDYRIKGPAPIVVPLGQRPPVVYGQEQNRIIEIKERPKVEEYKLPEVKPYEAPKRYEAPGLEDHR